MIEDNKLLRNKCVRVNRQNVTCYQTTFFCPESLLMDLLRLCNEKKKTKTGIINRAIRAYTKRHLTKGETT